MAIKEITEEIFKQNTDYARPEQAINQSQSLNALSRDLYTDARRFVYELLQNADDSTASGNSIKVSIRLFGRQLVIAHSGKPFDKRDLRGLCGVNDGTKKNLPDKTGFKGIGFKAVFGQSDNVIVFSQGEYFRFDSKYQHGWKENWGESQEKWEKENDRTFEFPWQIIPIYTEPKDISSDINLFLQEGQWTVATIVTLNNTSETIEAIRDLSGKVNMFLFLKSVEEIDFNVGEKRLISIGRLENQEVILKLNQTPHARWLIKNINLAIPSGLKASLLTDQNIPQKLKSVNQIELAFAAKIGENGIEALPTNERLLYAYLPTEEQKYSIPVLVNSAFLTVANRESLHVDSSWNQWLFNNIPKELFKWIAELVTGDSKYQGYKILPDRLLSGDALTAEFNKGFDDSLNNIPFVVIENNKLVKVKEAIIDFTFLSDKPFVGTSTIRKFIIETNGLTNIHTKPFVPNTGSGVKLKILGVPTFEWNKVAELLNSAEFLANHSVQKNTELICYFKNLSEAEKPKDVNDTVLKNWPFVLDHKSKLKSPKDIFFPAPDDVHWNSPNSELSFLHPQLQNFLSGNLDIRIWLNKLGVVEKSDLTYLEKTILPNAAVYITLENAVKTIQSIFYLHQKGEINNEKVSQLGSLRLLTKEGTLLAASGCYFSEDYVPRVALEKIVSIDFYLSTKYLPVNADKSEWRRFFKLLGVKDGFPILNYPDRLTKVKLTALRFSNDYFELDDKRFKPAFNWFTASEYGELNTIFLIELSVDNFAIANALWQDVIKIENVQDLSKAAIAYWGNRGYPGWDTGDKVHNYLSWFIKNNPCIPTSNGTCQSSPNVFLNEEQIEAIGGKYLPIFEGVQLNSDWRAFFQFKTQLELKDYLDVLTSVSEDPKGDNKKRIQSIYEYLLASYSNWSSAEQQLVNDWSITGKLLDQTGIFRSCSELSHYLDGDNSIFQNAYHFINLSKSNQQHSNLTELLALLQIKVLRQSIFQLKPSNQSSAIEFSNKLKKILPYWAKWIEKDVDGGFEQLEYKLQQKVQDLEIFQADELLITYGEEWSKKVSVHFSNRELYVLNPWGSAKVMLTLPEKLCDYFEARGYQSQLSFLLKSTEEEIIEYFKSEEMDLPPIEAQDKQSSNNLSNSGTSVEHKHPINYQAIWQENLRKNSALIKNAGNDPEALLLNGLQDQIPGQELNIYHFTHLENAVSIIKEGAIKNRSIALFKDSASAGVIEQTEEERKKFARFYFRTQTPTQYYMENWGRGQDALDKLDSDPVCPVPIFFIIPLREVVKNADWSVSLGSLASPQVEFGKTFELISKFDFEDLYKNKQEISHERFMVSSHQEFLISGQLNLTGLNYRIGVQDENAKESLLAMLNNCGDLKDRIDINPKLYHNGNPKIEINSSPTKMIATFNEERPGQFVLQYIENNTWTHLKSNKIEQFYDGNLRTTFSEKFISLSGDLADVKYNLFYCYKGHLWLVHTNRDTTNYDGGYIKKSLEAWLNGDNVNPESIIQILKTHPELSYWYEQSVGGSDRLTLEQHTLQVIKNYSIYFEGKQSLLPSEKIFLVFLALHDIGKPLAISLGDKAYQHEQSLIIIDRIKEILPFEKDIIERIKILINGDIIGKYLNPKYSFSIQDTLEALNKLAEQLSISIIELLPSLVIYYQSDAAGYNSLRRLFKREENGKFDLIADGSRFEFAKDLEIKFQELENSI